MQPENNMCRLAKLIVLTLQARNPQKHRLSPMSASLTMGLQGCYFQTLSDRSSCHHLSIGYDATRVRSRNLAFDQPSSLPHWHRNEATNTKTYQQSHAVTKCHNTLWRKEGEHMHTHAKTRRRSVNAAAARINVWHHIQTRKARRSLLIETLDGHSTDQSAPSKISSSK